MSEILVAPPPVAPSWAERHPLAAELDGAAPGPQLAERLAGCEPADVDDAALVELVAGWERVGSWAAAGQAAALAELSRRRLGERAEHLGDEVAARLTVTRAVAEGKVALAIGLDRLPAVGDALAAGALDVRRATVLADELTRLPEHVALEVAAAVLPVATGCTAPQLRQRLRRLELERDPDGAAVRHRRACEHRRVELAPAPDAMAWLTAYLPATDAVAVRTTLTALASDVGPEDGRTLDQRRADALVDLATRWLDAGAHPEGGRLGTVLGRAPHLVLTATAGTILGIEDQPAVLDGYGVVPSNLARRLAARSTWEPLLVDASSGEPLARGTRRYAPTQALRDAVVTRDRTCTFPGCRVPAARCDIDHISPYVAGGPDGRVPSTADDGQARMDNPQTRTDNVQTRMDNLQALCRHHHRAKTHAGWEPERRPDGTTTWSTPTGHEYVRPPEWPDPHPPPPSESDAWAWAWGDVPHDAGSSTEGARPAGPGAEVDAAERRSGDLASRPPF